jgi:hypothetical protein
VERSTLRMSNQDTFVWGVLGGFAGYVAVFILPYVRELIRAEGTEVDLTVRRLAGFILLALTFSFLGGVAALLIGGATEPKHAIAYGLGFEAIFKGALTSPPTRNPPSKSPASSKEQTTKVEG